MMLPNNFGDNFWHIHCRKLATGHSSLANLTRMRLCTVTLRVFRAVVTYAT